MAVGFSSDSTIASKKTYAPILNGPSNLPLNASSNLLSQSSGDSFTLSKSGMQPEMKMSAIDGQGKILSKSAQDITKDSIKKTLKDLEKQIKDCKRENYATQEEFEEAYNFLCQKKMELLEQLKELDTDYTETETKSTGDKLGALGGFFKDVCEGIKNIGLEIVQYIGGLFKGGSKVA